MDNPHKFCYLQRRMSSLSRLRHRLFIVALLQPLFLFSQASDNGIHPLIPSRPGEQIRAQIAFAPTGGYAVWQDSLIDGKGFGIAAVSLNSDLSAKGEVFRVNVSAPESQTNPRLALLKDGGCVVAWQGGKAGLEDVFVRFRGPRNSWMAGDQFANTYRKSSQVDPAVACLANGSVVVIWSSAGQDGSLMGIYGQRFSAGGAKVGAEFRLNQFTPMNQRNASVAALPAGGFIATWISEQQRASGSKDIYARLFTADARPLGVEFIVNTSSNQCDTPVITGLSDGFAIAWQESVTGRQSAASDIVSRVFNLDGSARSPALTVSAPAAAINKTPAIAAAGPQIVVTWSSLASGPAERIYGRNLGSDNSPLGDAFLVSTESLGRKANPTVATDSQGRVLAVWSEYVFGGPSFDLLAKILR